jgi:hypothetical protein
MNALLVHGGKITAKGTKDGSPILGTKTARNLLAQFHHAQIGFGQIVGLSRQLHRLHLWRKEESR